MLCKSLVVLFVLYMRGIDGSSLFRDDYTFSEQADGWLKLHLLPATWSDAKLRCHAEGAVLASPLTRQLKQAIIDYLGNERPHTIYTGVHATYSQGDYSSIEGVPLSELSIEWALGQPDNYQNSESCLAMMLIKNATMKDVNCKNVYPYVCYKASTELGAVSKCGTTDQEYFLEPRTGSCYKFHPKGLTWTKAYMTCAAEMAHLAIINSELEKQVLTGLFSKYPSDDVFASYNNFASVGVRDGNDGGSWMTIHGETLSQAGYDHWASGEPNNMSQPYGEFCGSMHRNGGLLDIPCDTTISTFICEMTPHNITDL